MNGNLITKLIVRDVNRIMYLVTFFSLLYLVLSCVGKNDANNTNSSEYIDIYYMMGYVDTDRPCEKEFQDSEVLDKGNVYINREEYKSIIQLLTELDSSNNDGSTYGMFLQGNFYFDDGNHSKLCIGQFGDMTMNGKSFVRKDNLVYLLRMHSGFYDYYGKDDLVKFCEELTLFGIPENYSDHSLELDTSSAFYAKIRILVE